MRKYIIEREIPGIGGSTSEQFCDAANTSNGALAQIGEGIQWVQSYVAADKTFCVYLAENEDLIREHARISGFPANKITEIVTIIDPTTAKTSTAVR
ncbi:MAG TPA: DUF4242 domain-containing protein [Gemmatimonadota bacterium]|nr:DUF4242 domain-containing protein [Gemmatimonadota bacterium]